MTITRATFTALVVAFTATLAAPMRAQQGSPVAPQIPQPIFRAPEDVWKTGVKPGEIKAGVRPDYTTLRDRLVVIPVQGNIYLIGGAGANLALQVSDEGLLLVDTGDLAASDKVIAETAKYAPRKLRWIINTSVDLDHTGGNGKIAKSGTAGQGAAAGGFGVGGGGGGGGGGQAGAFNGNGAGVIAFETVLNRMSAPTGQTASRSIDDQPTDTFFTAKKNFWYGNEPIEMWNQPAGHSDGDLIVFFRKSDVIVAGDILAGDRYPYIDAKNGGSIQGIIDGLNRIVGTAVPQYNQQGGTRIVPGHGRVMNQTDVVEYRDMATIVRDRIAMLAKAGKTLAEVKAARPTLDYDGNYGSITGPWTTDMFIEEVYREVTPKPAVLAKPAAPVSGNKPATKTSKSAN